MTTKHKTKRRRQPRTALALWKQRYYRIDAHTAARRGALAAIRHSLQKWNGLTDEALAEAGCERDPPFNNIVSSGESQYTERPFSVDADTCALCVRHINGPDRCFGCPLVMVLGHSCDDDGGPYGKWQQDGDAAPMIEALENAEQLTVALHASWKRRRMRK